MCLQNTVFPKLSFHLEQNLTCQPAQITEASVLTKHYFYSAAIFCSFSNKYKHSFWGSCVVLHLHGFPQFFSAGENQTSGRLLASFVPVTSFSIFFHRCIPGTWSKAVSDVFLSQQMCGQLKVSNYQQVLCFRCSQYAYASDLPDFVAWSRPPVCQCLGSFQSYITRRSLYLPFVLLTFTLCFYAGPQDHPELLVWCFSSSAGLMLLFLFTSTVLNSDFQPLELALPLTTRLETPSPSTLM